MTAPLTDEQLKDIEGRDLGSLKADAPHNPDIRTVLADRKKLLAEVKRLKEQVEKLDRDLDEEIGNRDEAYELLDSFAYTIAPIEVIGEHSSGNDPWDNALDMVTPAAEAGRQAELLDRVTAQLARWRHIRNRQDAAAEMQAELDREVVS